VISGSTLECNDLDDAIAEHATRGFRLDMIMPADAPRTALMSRGEVAVRLTQAAGNRRTVGRAGMIYRDLVPDRFGGRLIASHIAIVDGGPVPDAVHYHKVALQIICCLKGAIRVVYEDQGPPFWLRPGDVVLQPPEIRHRVLEAEPGSEVIEITSPAEHETWFDHEMTLPTRELRPERVFGKMRFFRHLDADAVWELSEDGSTMAAHTKLSAAGTEMPEVYTLRSADDTQDLIERTKFPSVALKLLVGGRGIRVTL